MFGSNQHDAQSHATAAWNELVDALESTRDTASERARGLGHEAGRRVTGAMGVLAGRPAPSRTWPILGAIAAGVAVGWVASEAARRRRVQLDEAMASIGTELKQAKQNIDDRIATAKTTPGGPIERAKAAVNSEVAR